MDKSSLLGEKLLKPPAEFMTNTVFTEKAEQANGTIASSGDCWGPQGTWAPQWEDAGVPASLPLTLVCSRGALWESDPSACALQRESSRLLVLLTPYTPRGFY